MAEMIMSRNYIYLFLLAWVVSGFSFTLCFQFTHLHCLSFVLKQTEWKVALYISWIEFVLIVLLNSLLVILLLKKRPKSRMAFFVLHLSLSDLAIGLIYLMPEVYQRTAGQWFTQSGEKILCSFYLYLSHVVGYASTYMLVTLTIDRLYVILRPLNSSKRGRWYKYGMITAAWTVAFILALPEGTDVATMFKVENGKYMCDIKYKSELMGKVFVTLFVCAIFVVPLIILIVCYMWIAWIIWSRKDLSGHQTGTYGNKDSSEKQVSGGSNIMTRAKIRSVQMALVVVIVYVISWSPLMINILFSVYGIIKPGTYYLILMALAPLNSAANPLVFIIFNHNMIFAPSVNDKPGPSAATVTTYLLQTKSRTSPHKYDLQE